MFIGNVYRVLRVPSRMIIKSFLALFTLLTISNNLLAKMPAAPQSALTHSLGMLEFTLDNEKQNCQVKVNNKSENKVNRIPLLLESPCYWIASESKALLHYSYESIGVDNTLLVAGTPLDWSAEKKTYQKLPANSYCTQFLQGIILSKQKVYAVNEKMIAAHCEIGLAIDEKIFYAIAHNPDRYQKKLPVPAKETAQLTEAIKNTQSSANESLENTKEKSFLDSVADSIKNILGK